jgi:copper resistance protein C
MSAPRVEPRCDALSAPPGPPGRRGHAPLLAKPLLALLLLALAASPAAAHAFLDHALPAVGSELPTPPAQVTIWFTQELEPAFSTIEVSDQSGARVDAGDSQVDPKDATVLHVSLKKLPPGKYKVMWRVVSVDTHPTEGTFTFTVGG